MAQAEVEKRVEEGDKAAKSLFRHGTHVGMHVAHSKVTTDPAVSSERAAQKLRELASHRKRVDAHLNRKEARQIIPEDGVLPMDFTARTPHRQGRKAFDPHEDGVLAPSEISSKDLREIDRQLRKQYGDYKSPISVLRKRYSDEALGHREGEAAKPREEKPPRKELAAEDYSAIARMLRQPPTMEEMSAALVEFSKTIKKSPDGLVQGVNDWIGTCFTSGFSTPGGVSLYITPELSAQLQDPKAREQVISSLKRDYPGFRFSVRVIQPVESGLPVPSAQISIEREQSNLKAWATACNSPADVISQSRANADLASVTGTARETASSINLSPGLNRYLQVPANMEKLQRDLAQNNPGYLVHAELDKETSQVKLGMVPYRV